MYRVAIESVLGVRVEGGLALVVQPCIPDEWPGFRVDWRVPGAEGTHVEIVVRNPDACSESVPIRDARRAAAGRGGRGRPPPLPRDGARHRIEVVLGAAAPVRS